MPSRRRACTVAATLGQGDDEALAVLERIYRNVPCGDPTNRNNVMGPLINAAQHDRVLSYIEKGKADGARLVVGGGRPQHFAKGYYIEPTLFTDVDNTMDHCAGRDLRTRSRARVTSDSTHLVAWS